MYYEDLGAVFMEYLFNEVEEMVIFAFQQRGSAMIVEMKKGQDAEVSETKYALGAIIKGKASCSTLAAKFSNWNTQAEPIQP